MTRIFAYVQYSQAQMQWSWQYDALIWLIGVVIFIGLWIGYRNNEIEDEKKKLAKDLAVKARNQRLKKLESLYPKKQKKDLFP